LCRSHQNVTNVGGDDFDEDDFLRRLRLVTSRVLVADASELDPKKYFLDEVKL